MEQKKKNKNKSFDIVFGIFVIGVVIIGAIYLKNMVKPEVTINGEKLKLGMTVQELVDAGFSVGLNASGNGGLNLDVQPQIPGESYSSKFYYIFRENESGMAEYTNVVFMVYNSDVNSCDFKDGRIYSYSYSTGYKYSDVEVLINGTDITGMEKEEALLALEEKGIKFDSDDKEEFLNGEIGLIIGKSGEYSFILETDYDKKVIEKVEVRRKV